MTTIPIQEVRTFSYSRSANDENCRRMRYLEREWGGTGLVPIHEGWALLYGNICHKALEELAKTGRIDYSKVRAKVQAESKAAGMDLINQRDWTALTLGTLQCLEQTVWPLLMAEYEILGTEKWIEYKVASGFLFRARQDLLLRNKFDGHILLLDYKTTSSTKPQWIKSWAKSVQLHSSMYALRQSEGINVDRALIIGLYKGYKDDRKGLQRSVFNYGYVNREFGMTPEYSVEYKRGRGWEMFSPLEEFEDYSQWLSMLPRETVAEQFPQTAPIMLREDIAETWFRQQLIREREVDEAAQLLQEVTTVAAIDAILDKYFRQNFSKCEPAYGFDCSYKDICWIPTVKADPLASGLFKRHTMEFELE